MGDEKIQASGAPVPLDKGRFGEANCLNCGTALNGEHCHSCGQQAHLHRTIGAFVHDLLHGALHFEGRVWKTLPKLAFRPGELTRRYIDGERRKFVAPMALFLFSVFLMFAVFQLIGISAPTAIDTSVTSDSLMSFVRDEAVAERNTLRDDLAEMRVGDPDYDKTQSALAKAEADVTELEQLREQALGENGKEPLKFDKTGSATLDKAIAKWRENPGLMLYKLQANAYKFSWLLIPISVPFVWLLFGWKRQFKAYDHAVFVTYSLAFMTLLFLALSLLGKFGAPNWTWLAGLVLVPPLHLYKQLRGTYQLSRFSAAWRLIAMIAFITIAVILFVQLIVAVGFY